METIEVKCENCGKPILILEKCTKEKTFCTLGCMGMYDKKHKIKN